MFPVLKSPHIIIRLIFILDDWIWINCLLITFTVSFGCCFHGWGQWLLIIIMPLSNKLYWTGLPSLLSSTKFIDIQKDTKAAGKYKVVVVPTIIIFKDGEEVARYQANIMMVMETTKGEIQGKIDEILMESF